MTRLLPTGATAALFGACATLAGCGGGSARTATAPPTRYSHASFSTANFAIRPTVVNRWLPLVPGTQWVRVGTTLVGHRPVPHRVVSTVTDVSRRVDGVTTIVVLDQGIDAGQLAHESIDFFAQDRRGNVWSIASYAESIQAGLFVSVRDAWMAGVEGARPGILMPANPTTQTPPWTIAQPPGADPDAAQAVMTGQSQCVPFHCFKNVLVVREGKASALDNEFKYYASGVGQILNTPKSKSKHKDTEALVNLVHLSRVGLSEFSTEALKLDKHARTTSADVFAHSPAAARTR